MTAPSSPPVAAPRPPPPPRVAGGGARRDSGEAEAVTAAVNAYVRRIVVVPEDGTAWADDRVLGATMLAARLLRRKNSPGGVESFGSEQLAYVRRSDPDIDRLLGLGRPGIG
jgi:hypothetical protein